MWGGNIVWDPFKYVYLQYKQTYYPAADNWVYCMHRRWSYLVLLISLIVSTCSAVLLGSPVACMLEEDTNIPMSYLEYYCWIAGTYLVKEHMNGTIGVDVPHPGIGQDTNRTRIYYLQYLKYHLMILTQFALFCISKHMLPRLQGNQLKSVVQEFKLLEIDDQDETLNEVLKRVADYMTSPMNFHNSYAWKYILCEMFIAVSFIFQVWMLNSQLHYEFLTFGLDAITYIQAVSAGTHRGLLDPFMKIFPKVTKCELKSAGPGGDWIPYDAICILPLHGVMDKIFFVIWFWLVALGFITFLGIMYRVGVLCSRNLRYIVLRLRVNTHFLEASKLRYFVNHSTYGTWFVVSHLEKKLPVYLFSRLVIELVEKLEETEGKDKEL